VTNADQLGGVSASAYVQTNDARLTDARTPLAHTHTEYTLTTDSRLSDARTPLPHTHPEYASGSSNTIFDRGLSPEFPNSILTTLGETDIHGIMLTEHDLTINKPYIKWYSAESTFQHYGIVITNWIFTTGKTVTWNEFDFDCKISGSAVLRMRIYDTNNVLMFTKTVSSTTGSDWQNISLDTAEIAEINGSVVTPSWSGNKFRIDVRLTSKDNGEAYLSDIHFKYTAV
jgi:hypothetical protein